MTLYLNTKTGEYPRHIGDVELDPQAPWAVVTETTPPEAPSPFHIVYEGTPSLEDGVYVQTWEIRELSEAEVETIRVERLRERLSRMGITQEDLKLILEN